MAQVFKSNITFSVVCVFTMQIEEWCVHSRLFNANFEDKFKETPDISIPGVPTFWQSRFTKLISVL
jgi:hypothetical protein